MTAIMKGVRVLEVAEHAFVPAAGALLSDWGAEVIKIEPVERGDAARGLTTVGGDVNLGFENANRGKRSLALDLASEDGREVLYRLAETCDVFLTNKLPQVRRKLKIDVEHIRARNPRIVYVRGDGAGPRGPEAERGSYDLLSYWHRSGASNAVTGADGQIPFLPAPGFGDFTGAMFIAGGTMGALFHRERTGEAPVMDASLLATGMWAMSGAIAAATHDPGWRWPPPVANPLSRVYTTKDGRLIAMCCLQTGYYWPIFTRHIGRDDLAEDARFGDHATILANNLEAIALLREEFARYTLAEWSERLVGFPGQWTVAHTAYDVHEDPQVEPNGYLQTCHTAAGLPFKLVAAPLQYDGEAARPRRGPEFNEHGDAILGELGLDWDAIVDLKVRGVVA
jgi:crotonobetainyl-CoA:carnitine CoA-transferase CaiB-like acyl-CoA transferase